MREPWPPKLNFLLANSFLTLCRQNIQTTIDVNFELTVGITLIQSVLLFVRAFGVANLALPPSS